MLQQVTDLGEEFLALGRCDWCRCLGAAQGIDHFDESKDAGADDDELDDRVDEASVADNRRVLLGFNDCLVMLAIERKVEILERDSFEQHSDWGHDDIRDQGCDDFPEGGSHDDTDGEIDHIPTADELLEFSEDFRGGGNDGLGGFLFGQHEIIMT